MDIIIRAMVDSVDSNGLKGVEEFNLTAGSIETAVEKLYGLQNYLSKKEAEALAVIEDRDETDE